MEPCCSQCSRRALSDRSRVLRRPFLQLRRYDLLSSSRPSRHCPQKDYITDPESQASSYTKTLFPAILTCRAQSFPLREMTSSSFLILLVICFNGCQKRERPRRSSSSIRGWFRDWTDDHIPQGREPSHSTAVPCDLSREAMQHRLNQNVLAISRRNLDEYECYIARTIDGHLVKDTVVTV